ncbi:MAG: hypothetical protein HY814_09895 [Candidatus Riflebacteria bacterium]|nr:hypothetical protein [Candidatus Riflebacteria bacterium]
MSDVELGGLHVFGFRATCPVCGEPPEEPAVRCPRCGTPHHADCWAYAAGCALFGCQPEPLRPTVPPPDTPLAWLLWLARPRNPDRAWLSMRGLMWLLTMGVVASSGLLFYGYHRLVLAAERDAERHLRQISSQVQVTPQVSSQVGPALAPSSPPKSRLIPSRP